MSARGFLVSTLVFTPMVVNAKIISKETYNYPILDPDEATIAASAIHTPASDNERISVRIKDRRLEDYLEHRQLEARLYKSAKPTDHLVFIISGIGGNHEAVYSKLLAFNAQKVGADAVIIPNIITENFIISSSTTGLVGGSAADADDLYEGLMLIKQKLADQGRRYARVSLVGYSHGALVAAFLESADQRSKMLSSKTTVSFDSALLINPPVDLLHAIRNIDARSKATGKLGLKRLIKLALRFQKAVKHFIKLPTTSESHVGFSNALKMKPEDRYALIGKALTISLPSAILATQAVDDLGIFGSLSPKGSALRRLEENARRQQAKSYGYEDYVTKFFTKRAKMTKQQFSLAYLNSVNSLHSLAAPLATSNSIFLMHNMDDLLLMNGQAYWLDRLFGDRALIYPTGGHLGNLWFDQNVEAYRRWITYGKF